MGLYIVKRTAKSNDHPIRNLHYIVSGKTSRIASAKIRKLQRQELKEITKGNTSISYEVIQTIKNGSRIGPLMFLVAGIIN